MKITDLLKCLDQACPEGQNKKVFLEMALAVEIGFSAALPSSPVASVVQYFEEMTGPLAKRVIGEINEMYPISVQTCYNSAVDFYKARYALVHEPRLLTNSDVASLLNRSATSACLTDDQAAAVFNTYASTARSSFADFITRYIAPAQAA